MKPTPPAGAPIVRTTSAIFRCGDEEVARLTGQHFLIRHPSGKVEQLQLYDHLALPGDNTFLSAAMLTANPRVDLCCCWYCRHPPYSFPFREKATHGLMRLERAKSCAGPHCGIICCSRHLRRGRDGRYRCPSCSWRWKLRRVFQWILFEG